MSKQLSRDAQVVVWVMGALRDLEYEGFIAECTGYKLTGKGVAECDQIGMTLKPTEMEIIQGLILVMIQEAKESGLSVPPIMMALKIGKLLKAYRDNKDELLAMSPRSKGELG